MNRNHFGNRGEAWVVIQGLLFVLFLLMPQVGPAWPAPMMFGVLGAIAVLGGIAVLGSSVVSLGKSLTPFPRPLPRAQLVTSGAYRLVRPTIYFGLLLAALGISLLTLSPLRIALTLLLGVFFDRKATLEERWLLERYPDYPAYQARVRKLLPYLSRAMKPGGAPDELMAWRRGLPCFAALGSRVRCHAGSSGMEGVLHGGATVTRPRGQSSPSACASLRPIRE